MALWQKLIINLEGLQKMRAQTYKKLMQKMRSQKLILYTVGGMLLLAFIVWLVGKMIGSSAEVALRKAMVEGGLPIFFVIIIGINVVLVPFSSDILIALSPTIFPDAILTLAVMAAASALIAAWIDLTLARMLGARFVKRFLGAKVHTETEALVDKYGVWAIALTAITPLPFSAVCWVCGLLGFSTRRALLAVALTRVPRHLIALTIGINAPEWLEFAS